MVNHAEEMIKSFIAKLKFPFRERKQKTTFEDLNGTDDESPETSHAVDNHKNVPSGGQTDTESIQSPEAVIVREVNKTMLPFLDDMSDADFQNLQVDSSLETIVPRGVLEELQESEGTDKKTQGSSVKGFFTLHFSKTWLNRILDQMKRKFRKDSDMECSPVLMKHIEDIIPELLRLDDDEAQFGKQKCMPPMLKGIPRSNCLVITRKLTNMLFQRMMGGLTFAHSASSSNATMYHEIWYTVWNFTGLLRWWQKTQIAPLAQRMRSALVNRNRVETSQTGKMEDSEYSVKPFIESTTFRDRLVPDLNGTDDESPETSHAVDNHKNVEEAVEDDWQ
uniref:uncharacterized protein LOC120824808 n=1 Tax=Gasterosteus aculeatus aculeatus TaxID=481459 RepID=UPI001A99ABF2|nr:uncharacterized protein LOC120824808 [Gasterosteus aculeatus aculeatus]